MKKNANKLFLVAGLLAMSAVLLTGCGSRKKTDAVDSVIKISTAPEPTATPDPKTVDPDAVTELGSAAVTPTPAAAASDGSTGDSESDTSGADTSDGDSTDGSDSGDGSDNSGDSGYSDENGDNSSYDDTGEGDYDGE